MPKGLLDFTERESLAPYVKAVVATTNEQAPSRAIHMKGSAASVNLDVGGETIAFYLLQGHTYPISVTKASATTVVLLY
jgi:cytochrome bd-type quinol oxidase subunit 1